MENKNFTKILQARFESGRENANEAEKKRAVENADDGGDNWTVGYWNGYRDCATRVLEEIKKKSNDR